MTCGDEKQAVTAERIPGMGEAGGSKGYGECRNLSVLCRGAAYAQASVTVCNFGSLLDAPALQVLSDDEKRSIYDRFGEAGLKGAGGPAGQGVSVHTSVPANSLKYKNHHFPHCKFFEIYWCQNIWHISVTAIPFCRLPTCMSHADEI